MDSYSASQTVSRADTAQSWPKHIFLMAQVPNTARPLPGSRKQPLHPPTPTSSISPALTATEKARSWGKLRISQGRPGRREAAEGPPALWGRQLLPVRLLPSPSSGAERFPRPPAAFTALRDEGKECVPAPGVSLVGTTAFTALRDTSRESPQRVSSASLGRPRASTVLRNGSPMFAE